MKKLYTGTVSAAAALLLTLTAACHSIEYQGVSESPLPSDAPVMVYYAASQIRTPSPQILGRASFQTATSTTRATIVERLSKFARKHGANGILIVSIDRVKTGEARQDQVYNQRAPGWDVEDNSATALTYTSDTIMYADSHDPDKAVYVLQVKADLLLLPETALEKEWKN